MTDTAGPDAAGHDGAPPAPGDPASPASPATTGAAGAAGAGSLDAPGATAGPPGPDPAAEPPALDPELWRIVAVSGVTMELPAPNPEVVLHEAQDPWRELRIPVGMAEGSAIAYAVRGIETPRPLTHALAAEILDRHDVAIVAVRITVRRGQVFFAEIDTTGPRGRRIVPARPSDAIALALRQKLPVPVLVGEWVFTGDDVPPGFSPAT